MLQPRSHLLLAEVRKNVFMLLPGRFVWELLVQGVDGDLDAGSCVGLSSS